MRAINGISKEKRTDKKAFFINLRNEIKCKIREHS